MVIPFLDLTRQYRQIKPEVDQAINAVLQAQHFVGGHAVAAFEAAFAQAVQQRHCIGTGNATDALFAILRCLDIGPGHEVITPAFGWISSAETISLCGATPVFADVDPQYHTLNATTAAALITSRTRAIVAVNLYGQPADLQALQKLCQDRGLLLIEDCAQAHLARYHDQAAGTFGHAAAFSFYPTKNLGAYGDGGCVITPDDTLATRIRRFCNHGGLSRDEHQFEGINSRLDSLQAAVLSVKLKYLASWNEARRHHAARYTQRLQSIPGISIPATRPAALSATHLFPILVNRREALQQYLAGKGIGTLIHYPQSLPELSAYQQLGHSPEDFPVASHIAAHTLSLPLQAETTEGEINHICDHIGSFQQGE